MASQPEKSEEGKENVESSLDRAKKAVRANLLEKRDELIDEVEEAFNKKISAGSDKLDERALDKMLKMKNQQINEIAAFFNEKIKEFEHLSADRAQESDKIATDMMEKATEKAKKRIGGLKAILEAKVSDQHVTTAEVGEIETAINAMKQFEQLHPEAEKTFMKLSDKGELSKDDYERVVGLINPIDARNSASAQQAMEAASTSLLVSMMRPDQRYELVRTFMDSRKKEGSVQLIDAMMKTGSLSKMQGEKLLGEAKSKGVNITAEFEQTFKNTDYKAEAKAYQEALEDEAKRKYGGRYSENIVNRFSGKPFFYFLAMCWGTVTLGMNILVNRKRGDKFGAVLGRMAKNPYVWASTAAIGGGMEGMFGSLKTGKIKSGDLLMDWGMGAGPISRGIESWSEKGDEEKIKERARGEMERLYTGAPEQFREYLDHGGFETMQEVRKEILEKKLDPKITVDQLIEKETNVEQKKRLSDLKSLTFSTESAVSNAFSAFSEAAHVMEIKKNADLQPELKSFRDKQGSKE